MNTTFQRLMQDFASLKGLTWASESLGLNFETETAEILVLPHPLDPDRALVEVAVRELNDLDQSRLAPLMLQINEVARFEHDWRIVMDEQGLVILCTDLALAPLRAEDLDTLLADGLDRGQLLQDLIESALQEPPPRDGLGASGPDAGMLRA